MQKKTLLAIVLAGLSSVALAAMMVFTEVDVNADGSVSAEEAAAVEGLDFAAADANADGMLDQAEYEAATAE